MDLAEQPDVAASFARHPWELARYRFFAGVLARAGLGAAPLEVLDAGAGDAWFARTLTDETPAITRTVCWDAAYTAAELGRRDGRVVYRREPPAGRFGLVLLLDVLEHVEDDRAFLGAIVRDQLLPGGLALISVPAWPELTTRHDHFLRHHRRYRPAAARALLDDAGLVRLRGGGLFHALLPMRGLQKLRESLGPPVDHAPAALGWRGGRLVTMAIGWALRGDNLLSTWAADRGMDLPGLSWWALCRTSS